MIQTISLRLLTADNILFTSQTTLVSCLKIEKTVAFAKIIKMLAFVLLQIHRLGIFFILKLLRTRVYLKC